MEFGCHLPVFGPAATRAGLLTFAREMERLGYVSLWASDHVVIPHAIRSRYPYSATGDFPLAPNATFLEPLATLALVAGVTERAKLGTTVLVLPHRHPVLAAKSLATLDHLSGGRVILGGSNLVPIDIEEIVDHVPGVRYSAAVGIESERTGSQRLHVVAEVREGADDVDTLSGLVREIVQRVHKDRGHRPARVLLVRPGTIPKTSSGKIQRSRLGQMIAGAELGDRLVYASGAHGE